MVDKIKICFISHWGYPLYNKKCKDEFGGGSAAQLYLLSKEFAKDEDFNVYVVAGIHNKRKKFEILDKIKIFSIIPTKKSVLNYIRAIINFFVYLIKINPDIVIERGAGIKTGFCSLYCKLFKKRFLFSIANLPDVNGAAERGFSGKIYKYGIDKATYIVAQHQDQINELEKFKRRKFRNIHILKSGYEIKDINLENKKNILWIARALDWKRPELFIKLAKKFPNEKFIMICNKSHSYIYWKNLSSKAAKVSNLEFIEYVPFHKVDKYFQKSKIFINTSKYEGFPNTFIQAFKNKTPVISLNVNPDKIFTNNKIGYFANNDFNKMVDYLNILLNNDDLYNDYSKNSFEFALNNYSIQKISYKWIQFIKKILNE